MELQKLPVQDMSIEEFKRVLAVAEPQSFNDIIASGSPSFKAIALYHGPAMSRALITIALADICKLLSFSISGEMISECAKNIDLEFYDCKIDDLNLFKSYLMRDRLSIEMYRNDALVLFKLYKEYYQQRENALEDVRVQQHNEEKAMWGNALGRAYANASPKSKKLIQETTEKLERFAREKRISEDVNRPTFTQKMTLEEIAEHEGIDFNQLAGILSKKAEDEHNANPGAAALEIFVSKVIAETLFQARKDPKYLHELLRA